MHLTICLPPVSKKNHGRIINVRGRPMMIPSKQFTAYQKAAREFMPEIPTKIDFPVNIKCVYHMPTQRKCDLVNLLQATLDVLVHYEVISDDNYEIVRGMDGSRVTYDKESPRTEIEITAWE